MEKIPSLPTPINDNEVPRFDFLREITNQFTKAGISIEVLQNKELQEMIPIVEHGGDPSRFLQDPATSRVYNNLISLYSELRVGKQANQNAMKNILEALIT